jgi:uncharacterized protein YecE (DUF72 family)
MTALIGTAGWSIPRQAAHAFSAEGSALERYASRFRVVEINSSFHRPHRPSTWARWASLVPADFRFAVKIPKEMTHVRKLVDCREPLAKFLDEVHVLGPKLAVLLIQLPPKLSFDVAIAEDFFALVATLTPTQSVCEPRHASWFDPAPDAFLERQRIARVAADPTPVPAAALPGGWRGMSYWRLHGSPRMYRSAYGTERLFDYAELLQHEQGAGRDAWCVFDNTASSAAIDDALGLTALVSGVSLGRQG